MIQQFATPKCMACNGTGGKRDVLIPSDHELVRKNGRGSKCASCKDVNIAAGFFGKS